PLLRAGAVVCYLLALAGATALAARVFLLGLGALPEPGPWPWVADLTWVVVFGVQHSGMARATFQPAAARRIPPRLERSVYAAASGLVLLGLALTWQRLDGGELWHGPPWLVVVPLAAGLGLVLVNLRFDHGGLFGLRQAWEATPAPEQLLVV